MSRFLTVPAWSVGTSFRRSRSEMKWKKIRIKSRPFFCNKKVPNKEDTVRSDHRLRYLFRGLLLRRRETKECPCRTNKWRCPLLDQRKTKKKFKGIQRNFLLSFRVHLFLFCLPSIWAGKKHNSRRPTSWPPGRWP